MSEILKSAYRKVYGLLGHRGLGKVPVLSQINGFFVQLLGKKPEYVEVEGSRMYLLEKDSAISSALPLLKKVEPTTTEFFKENMKEGDVVVDVGANIGYYTLIFSKKVGKTGKVFAFEPDPRNIPTLKKNVGANGCTNVVVVEKAVSDKAGKLKFHLAGTSDSSSIYAVDGETGEVEVETISLDEYFEKAGWKVDAIKMDVQGAEYAALLGMKKIIAKNPQIKIVAELEPKLLESAGVEPRRYLELAQELGFEIYNIDENKRAVGKADVDGLLQRYNKPGDNTNLLFARKRAVV